MAGLHRERNLMMPSSTSILKCTSEVSAQSKVNILMKHPPQPGTSNFPVSGLEQRLFNCRGTWRRKGGGGELFGVSSAVGEHGVTWQRRYACQQPCQPSNEIKAVKDQAVAYATRELRQLSGIN